MIALCLAVAAIAGAGYYFYTPTPPPPPANVTALLAQKMQERHKMDGATQGQSVASHSPNSRAASMPDGLVVTLQNRSPGTLTGKAVNSTGSAMTYSQPAGTLFGNGKAEVILLRGVKLEVGAKSSADLELSVAKTQADPAEMTGDFTPSEGDGEPLKPLLDLLADRPKTPVSVVEAAILMINQNIPLARLVDLPMQLPKSLQAGQPKSLGLSLSELTAALLLVKEAGFDIDQLALMSDPQLMVAAMLDRDARTDAMNVFGITQESEWTFWRNQLLHGDLAMRQYALYGIAQYFPAVALKMLPDWVRSARLDRGYRYSSAMALSLIQDRQAMEILHLLSEEQHTDPGMAQTLQRASQQWEINNIPPTASLFPMAASTESL